VGRRGQLGGEGKAGRLASAGSFRENKVIENKITFWCFQRRILEVVLKRSKPSPAESEFLFAIDPEPATERLTSYGGAAVLVQTLRSLGVAQSVTRHIHIKKRDRGYDEATFVESFVVLNGVVETAWTTSTSCAPTQGWHPCWGMTYPRRGQHGISCMSFMMRAAWTTPSSSAACWERRLIFLVKTRRSAGWG
jgi:hypothetical protein